MTVVSDPMLSKKDIRRIVSAYYDLSFPGSYQGLNAFTQAVKTHLGLDVSVKTIRRILSDELTYQVHFPRKRTLWPRANYARGSNLTAHTDAIYFRYNKNTEHAKEMVFILTQDVFNRFLWGVTIPSGVISPKTIQSAFSKMFRRGMPSFPILR